MGLLASAEAKFALPRHLLAAFFPDDCRICGTSLQDCSAVPVCSACLAAPQPFSPDTVCQRCGVPVAHPAALDGDERCRLCRIGIRGFDASFAYGDYSGELRHLIQVFKYERVGSLARPLGGFLLQALPRHLSFDCVVPVPMHWWRKLRRGFNQAELLAHALSARTALPVLPLLRRTRMARVQAGLAGTERRRNAAHSLACDRGGSLAGKRILLVDDVLTTGATATACARLLKRAGASYVAVLTVARVDRRVPMAAIPAARAGQGHVPVPPRPPHEFV
jgi:ComF family protein